MHLRGENGSGKTTLLKLIAGLLHPIEGEIIYNGQSIYVDKARYQQSLCYVGHKSGVSQCMTVREHRLYESETRQLVRCETLSLLVPDEWDDIPVNLLSAGQRRRVALSRLVYSKAALWLLDEPYVALDSESSARLDYLMKQHLMQDGQIILTSHQRVTSFDDYYQEYCL